jgi:hypothetical protein
VTDVIDVAIMDALGRRLAELFPVAAQHRGWTVANLTHAYERTPFGVEELWSADIYGPTDFYSREHRFADRPGRSFTLEHHSDITGHIEADTPEQLVLQAKVLVDNLGLADLSEPP